MQYGDRIIIDRDTGKIIQMERITPTGVEQAARIMAKVLVDSLLKQKQKKEAHP